MGPSFPVSSDADFQLCLQLLSLLSPVLLTSPPFLGTWNTLPSFWLILTHPSSLSGCPTLWHLPHCGDGHATCRSREHLSCLLWSPRIQPTALSTSVLSTCLLHERTGRTTGSKQGWHRQHDTPPEIFSQLLFSQEPWALTLHLILVVTLQPPRAGLALRQLVFAFWFLSHFYVRGTVDFLAFRNESCFASSMIGSFLSFSWGLAFPLTLLGAVTRACSLCCCPFSWASKWRHRKQTRLQPHPESGPPCWSQSSE